MEYLVFTLAAPMASFGTVAVGERRSGDVRPTKSQIVGLLAAALGIERTENDRLDAIASGIGYAVRMDHPGTPGIDYHTAQVPPTTRKRRYFTRAEEMAAPKWELETVLSRREFRTDVLATVCVWLKGGGGPSLQSFVDALRTPAFTLAAGRKAFPLMLPCRPEIIAVTTVFDALQNYDMVTRPGVRDLLEARGMNTRDRGTPVRVYADAEAVLGATGSTHEHRQSRDVPVNRAKWQFDMRREVVVTWTEAPHG